MGLCEADGIKFACSFCGVQIWLWGISVPYRNKSKLVKEAAEQVIDQIDAMKKSILARAFRGEFGTNDPADESAEELLKRIL